MQEGICLQRWGKKMASSRKEERGHKAEEMPPFHLQYSSPCKIQVIVSAISSPVGNPASSRGTPDATSSGLRSALCPRLQAAQHREGPTAGWQPVASYTHLPPSLLDATPHRRTLLTAGFQHSNKLQIVGLWFPLLLPPPRHAGSRSHLFHPQPTPQLLSKELFDFSSPFSPTHLQPFLLLPSSLLPSLLG